MKRYRVGFLISQTLGHVVHDRYLRQAVAMHPEIQPAWMPILPWSKDFWQSVPFVRRNFTLLSGLRARDHLRHQLEPFDALYCHTQEATTLLGSYMKRIPTIVSLDATPKNMDSIASAYGHTVQARPFEHFKHLMTRSALKKAAHFVTFSDWAKQSLISDYDIAEAKVTVTMPAIDLDLWRIESVPQSSDLSEFRPRVLFVGGDFIRKGGETLLQSAASLDGKIEVDIVTGAEVRGAEGVPNVRVHRGLQPNSPELMSLYRKADIFALPTMGDCSSWAIIEAMAMQLPIISTRVGGIPEIVVDGVTGLLIPADSPQKLAEAISRLGADPVARRAMGVAGRTRVEQHFDCARNYRDLLKVITAVAAGNRAN